MTVGSDPELLAFAGRLLERHGGLIEPGEDRLLTLLPPELAQVLEAPEESEIGGEEFPLLYGSPLLDRLVHLATRDAPVAYGQINFSYLKKAGFEQLLGQELIFSGANVRLASRAEARSTYLVLICHYVALSDERKEGLIRLGLHEGSGALIPELPDLWEAANPQFFPVAKAPPHFPVRLAAVLKYGLQHAPGAVERELQDFLASMRRRLHRDVKNTREYYEALRLEMEAGLGHPQLTDSQRQERAAKIAALPQEMARKITDLEQKYRVRVTISAGAAVRLLVDVVQLLLELEVHRVLRSVTVIWNPLTRRLDPLVCESCRQAMEKVYPTPLHGRIQLLCFACSRRSSGQGSGVS
ncbi:MAG: hypothetical protein FJ135_08165 [Deltaproteobacteria bacterium]|nr:hypothetical protein [Deltaproteobacteria bacterium]